MKGITIPCPYCKEILLRHYLGSGDASFETLCPHCKELVTVCCGQESWITAHKAKLALVILLVASAYQVYTLFHLNKTITAVRNEYNIEVEN